MDMRPIPGRSPLSRLRIRVGALGLGLSIAGALALLVGPFGGCAPGGADAGDSSSQSGQGGANAGAGGAGEGGDIFAAGGSPGCDNLECQQVQCPGGTTTSVTGTVYDPAGKNPLYNVVVYVPNEPLSSIADGATCEQCGQLSGAPLVTTLTDTTGRFVLENVPVGADIPLVIQVGKWRRELTLPSVAECVENPVADTNLTRLPRNKAEGHIPKIALSTGGADPLECLLRKVGIDDAEFTLPSGDGRVNLYADHDLGDVNLVGTSQYAGSLNGGAQFPNSKSLWETTASLMGYDVVLLACELGQNLETKSPAAFEAIRNYADGGGRLFLSHWHNVWLHDGAAPWPDVATWDFQTDPPSPYTALVDQSFPKGEAMAEWLVEVGASTVLGELPISGPQHTVAGVDGALARRWIYGPSSDGDSVKYFSMNTPAGAADDALCGRIVVSDIHVSSGDQVAVPFPEGCVTEDLSPQERALEFMLFDLSSCIQPDDEPPVPPS